MVEKMVAGDRSKQALKSGGGKVLKKPARPQDRSSLWAIGERMRRGKNKQKKRVGKTRQSPQKGGK